MLAMIKLKTKICLEKWDIVKIQTTAKPLFETYLKEIKESANKKDFNSNAFTLPTGWFTNAGSDKWVITPEEKEKFGIGTTYDNLMYNTFKRQLAELMN